MTFVLIFPLPRNSFLYLSLYLYKICRSARSTRVDRSRSGRSANFFLLSSTLSFFFLVLFSKCTANYPPLISSRSRSPNSRITQDHPEGHACHYYRRLLKLPRTMPECYSSSLSLSPVLSLFLGGFFYICFGFVLTLYLSPSPRRATARAGRKGTSHRDRDRSLPERPRTNKEESPTCMYARFF